MQRGGDRERELEKQAVTNRDGAGRQEKQHKGKQTTEGTERQKEGHDRQAEEQSSGERDMHTFRNGQVDGDILTQTPGGRRQAVRPSNNQETQAGR